MSFCLCGFWSVTGIHSNMHHSALYDKRHIVSYIQESAFRLFLFRLSLHEVEKTMEICFSYTDLGSAVLFNTFEYTQQVVYSKLKDFCIFWIFAFIGPKCLIYALWLCEYVLLTGWCVAAAVFWGREGAMLWSVGVKARKGQKDVTLGLQEYDRNSKCHDKCSNSLWRDSWWSVTLYFRISSTFLVIRILR